MLIDNTKGKQMSKEFTIPQRPGTKVVNRSQSVRVALSDKEIEKLGRENAKDSVALAQLEKERKDSNKQFADDIKEVEQRIYDKAQEIHTGVAYRDVECRVEIYYKLREAVITRCDTGEIVETRGLTADEEQMAFDDL